ncbi:MAG: hypothetical protein AAGB14_12835 [Verrucomicrobiota bacterium]
MGKEEIFHGLAKDAGNRLLAYILSVASGGTGVFFLSLSGSDLPDYSTAERVCLLISLAAYVVTVVLCLLELRVDARRFFELAKKIESGEANADWRPNDRMKKVRFYLIHSSYVSIGIAIVTTTAFLILRMF